MGAIAIGATGSLGREEPYVHMSRSLASAPVQPGFEGIIGRSSALRRVLDYVDTVAPSDSTVLLLGETGTGKELVAQAIHNRSRRKQRRLVKINCAAIPSGLLESEMFGHERGAFTGALTQKPGRLELADHGTLFLDEIGDIPLELQPKLLRVMQEREFERLGSFQTRKLDVRFVAATHRSLEELIRDHKFRSDLYYRLNVFPISIPPLRDRRDDIPFLAWHFVGIHSQRMNKCIDQISKETLEAFMRYQWPGNIRELQNVIERAVILTDGRTLQVPLETFEAAPTFVRPIQSVTLKEAEREHILRTLGETEWVIGGPGGAATRLGLPRTTLIYKMQRLGIPGRRDLCIEYPQSRESNLNA